MKLSFRRREAIIQTVDRHERIAAGLESRWSHNCQLCEVFGGGPHWEDADCDECPVVKIFGVDPEDEFYQDSAPCSRFLYRPSLTATAAAMLAAVLGVKVPKQK